MLVLGSTFRLSVLSFIIFTSQCSAAPLLSSCLLLYCPLNRHQTVVGASRVYITEVLYPLHCSQIDLHISFSSFNNGKGYSRPEACCYSQVVSNDK